MRQLSTLLRREELESLRSRLELKIPPKNEWEEFRFEIDGYSGIVYKNGKVVYHEALVSLIESILMEDECIEIGSDEAGKGEREGPIVVAAVALDGERRKFLRARGLLESKSVPKKRIEELAGLIREVSISSHVKRVSPEELRELWNRGNLNDLLSIWHFEVVKEVLKDTEACRIIVDSFDRRRLEEAFSQIKGIEVIIESGADLKYPSVAAASILAKFEYQKSDKTGIKWT